MMNYHSMMNQQDIDDNLPICNPNNYKLQYISRMIIISISLFSSSFIGLTCLLNKKRSLWTFKILQFQSFFECTDLILALIFNRYLMEIETLEQNCTYIGYIMHASWLSSFCCCLLMIYQMRLLLKIDRSYKTLSKYSTCVLLLIWIIPYFWLFTPYILKDFVPTGWNSYQKKCSQYFYCGFDKQLILYSIFWTSPQFLIFFSGVYLARSNKNFASVHLSTFQDEEFKTIKDLQVFASIYGFSWLINQIIRYIDIIDPWAQYIVNQEWYYALYIIFNLAFELHLVIVLGFFLKNYGKVLNIKQTWLSLLCWQKRDDQQLDSSLLYQDINQTS